MDMACNARLKNEIRRTLHSRVNAC